MLLDLLLPHRCAACRAPGPPPLCVACAAEAERLALPDRGAVRLAAGVLAVGAFAYDGVIRDAIRSMKAGGWHGAARGFGEVLRRRLDLPPPGPGLALTWVPAHPRRRRQRGVDIPQLLAGPGARPLLVRTHERPDQTALGRAQRRQSPQGSFRARGPLPPAVVLVDDVRTTGGTALAAARALHADGASRVVVATLAVAGPGQGGLV